MPQDHDDCTYQLKPSYHHEFHLVCIPYLQKGELRCLLPRSLLDNGFFGIRSNEDKDNKKNISPISSYSWSGQHKVPSYLHKIVFPQEFMSTLRTIAMQDHELEQVASLLGEVSAFHSVF